MAAAFPHLQILELIGSGGMGAVFKARQPHLDRLVALKVLSTKLAGEARFPDRFNREGRVLARLNHPNIVSVYDFGQADGFYYLMMEYVDGANLRQAMQAGRFLPSEALAIVPRICEALHYAHEQGVLHRDIKPENILLDSRGRVKIVDFGIAKLMGEQALSTGLTATGAALGTPLYMAPEQIEKPSDVDHRADIYSLGVVFYEMLTGELPIGRFSPPSSRTPLDQRVDSIVLRALEKERELRQRSAGEFKTQVEQVASTPQTPSRPSVGQVTTDPSNEFPVDRRAAWGAGLVGVSLVLPLWVILALVFGPHAPPPPIVLAAFLSLLLPGLGGTVLGGMALRVMRSTPGRSSRLPLALFAALAWPLLLLGFFLVVIPTVRMLAARDAGVPGGFSPLVLMLLLLITGVLGIWLAHATFSWATHHPAWRRRTVLKWVAAGLICFSGALLVSRRGAAPPAAVTPMADPGVLATVDAPSPEQIRLTFTSVEILSDDLGRWLALDYLDDVQGAVQRVFYSVAEVPGFTRQLRTRELFVEPQGGSPAVRHQRVEFLLPPVVTDLAARKFKDELAAKLIGRSVVVSPGREESLFELPLPGHRPLSLSVGTAPATNDIETRRNAEDAVIQAARQRLEATRRDYDAGTVDRLALANAELDRDLAEARSDKHAVAAAGLRHAEAVLAVAREKYSAGTLSADDLRRAELDKLRAECSVKVIQAGGDRARIAQVDLEYADSVLEQARSWFQAGQIPESQLRRAENDRAQALARLQNVSARTQ